MERRFMWHLVQALKLRLPHHMAQQVVVVMKCKRYLGVMSDEGMLGLDSFSTTASGTFQSTPGSSGGSGFSGGGSFGGGGVGGSSSGSW